MSITRRTSIIPILVCIALLAAATAGATTVTGTAANDTLRGGAKADKLTGKGGNDKLYGLAGNDVLSGGAGNDLLVGGPGADALTCGPGSDTVVADTADKIGVTCETVQGLPKPTASVTDVTQEEGSTGARPMTFEVTLARSSPLRVTLSYATADGTATAGADYTTTSGVLAFAPGETSKTVAVPIIGDTTVEADETFSLRLASALNATIAQAQATGTIRNDDVVKPRAGHFHGQVSVGGFVDFDVSSDGTSITNLVFSFFLTCQPNGSFVDFARASFTIPIQPDGSFDASGSGAGFAVTFKGRFVMDTIVSGTVQVHESFDEQGTHYECDTGSSAWAAAWRG